jgi:hypothetical protein
MRKLEGTAMTALVEDGKLKRADILLGTTHLSFIWSRILIKAMMKP